MHKQLAVNFLKKVRELPVDVGAERNSLRFVDDNVGNNSVVVAAILFAVNSNISNRLTTETPETQKEIHPKSKSLTANDGQNEL